MNAAISGLIDIVEPTAPAAQAENFPWVWLAVALALLLVAAGALWWGRQRCQRTARKRLRQLRLTLLAGSISQQHTAYALAAELCQYFKRQQLQADAPPPTLAATEHTHWASLVAALDQLRYRADASIDAAQWTQLFAIAESSLRRSGRC